MHPSSHYALLDPKFGGVHTQYVSGVTAFLGPKIARVVFWPVSAGKKTIDKMTKRAQPHSSEQIVHKIQNDDRNVAEGGDVAAVLRRLNVTEATYYRLRNHYDGLKAENAKKLKHLKKQNLQLK